MGHRPTSPAGSPPSTSPRRGEVGAERRERGSDHPRPRHSPSPDTLRVSTSPRRGEVEACASSATARQRAEAWAIAAEVCDPEVPVLTIADLGVLRDVRIENGRVEAVITPTYSGCPAMNLIALNVEVALEEAGFTNVKVTTVLSPAWTTDWMSEEGKQKLAAFGIAPPAGKAGRRALFGEEEVACPRCGSANTQKVSEFGSTA
jgi:ring-1,2-phenylacetyl-CoA epoxidase subunit PaaD